MMDDSIDHQDDANNYGEPPNFRYISYYHVPSKWSWCIYIVGEMNDDDDIHHFEHLVTDGDDPSSSSAADEHEYFQLVEQSMKEYTASAQVYFKDKVTLQK